MVVCKIGLHIHMALIYGLGNGGLYIMGAILDMDWAKQGDFDREEVGWK